MCVKFFLKLVKTTSDILTQWCREGTYRLMTLAEYSRPSRVGYASQQGAGSAPVKVNRIVTVQGSNPEQKICLSTEGRQRHSSGFEPKAAGDVSSRCRQRTGQGKPHIHSTGFETRTERICI
jgi:hypothetical protein